MLAPVAISSMPQQAVANGIGQRLFLRHQLARRIEPADDDVLRQFEPAGRAGLHYRHRNTPLRQSYAKPTITRAMNSIAPPKTSPRDETEPSRTAASIPAADRLATAHG